MVPHPLPLALRFDLCGSRFSLDLIPVLQRSQRLVRADDYLVALVQPTLDFDLLIAFDPGGNRSEVATSVLAEYEHAFDFFLL